MNTYHLLDLFVHGDDVILWCKDPSGIDHFFKDRFSPVVYFSPADDRAESLLKKICKGAVVERTVKNHLVDGMIPVLRITFDSVSSFHQRFFVIEGALRGKGTFFDGDLDVCERYLFFHNLSPFCQVKIRAEGDWVVSLSRADDPEALDYQIPPLKILKLRINHDRCGRLKSLECNEVLIEKNMIEEFCSLFARLDPDVILIHKQQERLLALLEECKQHTSLHLNRHGPEVFASRKGYSFFSYGVRYYREAPLYLRGRFLINSGSFMDDSFTVYSLIEGSWVCRVRLQKTATHSVGRTVTNLLTYTAYCSGYLIPYKIGVYERLKSFRELVDCDRGALTLEPHVGLHRDVAELDFVSMYPSIISKHNLSPETLYCSCCKEHTIEGTPYWFCRRKKGIVPAVCDLLLSRRLAFKSRDDFVSSSKVDYLKWLLVVIFGFQAYKNKKIGCIEVHEAINAVARSTLLRAIRVAESEGYSVVHGIVDSLYVKKKGVTEEDARRLAVVITDATGLPIEFKHKYSFITFLPSVVNPAQPVPTAYYGVADDGHVKVRGIEVRQRTAPLVVKNLQQALIAELDGLVKERRHVDEADVRDLFERCVGVLRNHISSLDHATVDDLSITIRVGREQYKVNCPQKIVKEKLEARGVEVQPGQRMTYVIVDHSRSDYVDASSFTGRFDRFRYVYLLKKAFVHLFLPFGLDLRKVDDLLLGERQESLLEYVSEKVIAYAQ